MNALADRLALAFLDSFPAAPRAWRHVGREAEFPVVRPDGTAADIAALWPLLEADGDFEVQREGELVVGLQGPDVAYSAEVGRGTIEVIVGPYEDLHGIRAATEAAMARLLRAAEAAGVFVLGYGIQPVTPPSVALMSPKERYHVLYEVLGDAWLWFGVTASDQTHVEVSRGEVIAAADLANLLAPWTIALCANSPVHGGRDDGVCSGREAMMGRIHADAHRHGMPSSAAGDAREWIRRTLELDYLMHRERGRNLAVGQRFDAWVASSGLDDAGVFEAWKLHDHYVWNSARPRTAHGTLEMRAPCQQPWADHMAPAALALGMVAAHRALAAHLVDRLGADPWPAMRAWHHAAVRDGLAAPQPAPGLALELLEIAARALVERGRGEEVWLAPLFARARAGENPAQVARRVLREQGMDALIGRLRIR